MVNDNRLRFLWMVGSAVLFSNWFLYACKLFGRDWTIEFHHASVKTGLLDRAYCNRPFTIRILQVHEFHS